MTTDNAARVELPEHLARRVREAPGVAARRRRTQRQIDEALANPAPDPSQ